MCFFNESATLKVKDTVLKWDSPHIRHHHKFRILRPPSFLVSYTIPSDFIISRRTHSTQDSIILVINYSFIRAKGCTSEPAKGRDTTGQGLRVPNVKFALPSLHGVRTHYPPNTLKCDNAQGIDCQPGSSPKLPCPEFITEFHYLGVNDWTILGFNHQVPPLPGGQAVNTITWLKALLTSGWSFWNGQPHPEPFH